MISSTAYRWARVKWTEAGQVAAQLDDIDIPEADAHLPPYDWWNAEVTAGRHATAIRFLAMALPRFDAVFWAWQTIERCGAGTAPEQHALSAVSDWLDSPDDARRRSAWSACEGVEGPVRFLGMSLFFSGGSIAPEGMEDVPPGPTLCAVASAGAILATAHRTPDPARALSDALAVGDRRAAGES